MDHGNTQKTIKAKIMKMNRLCTQTFVSRARPFPHFRVMFGLTVTYFSKMLSAQNYHLFVCLMPPFQELKVILPDVLPHFGKNEGEKNNIEAYNHIIPQNMV